MDKTAKESQGDQPAKKPVAVRSAKDAINAMYADKDKSGLGDYLAMSAREIVNATDSKKGAEAKSAANLHKHAKNASNQRMESVRTSASALMRTANSSGKAPVNRLQAADPIANKASQKESSVGPEKIESKSPTVVRTSLKLKPKKPTVKLPTESQNRQINGIRLPKQSIPLNRGHTQGGPQMFQDVVRVNGAGKPGKIPDMGPAQSALDKSSGPKKPAQPSIVSQNGIKVKRKLPKGVSMSGDIKLGQMKKSVRTPLENAGIHLKKTLPTTLDDPEKPVLKSGTGSTHGQRVNPLDSIKKKFTPAPKGFAASNSREARPDRPYQVEDYLNPSHATKSVPATDDATHYYGLSEEELVGNTKGVQVNRDKMAAEAGLGMIEDYSSDGEPANGNQATVLRRDSPDNNKYALSAQSPYYLKPEKEMKKRPLSGNGVPRAQTEVATSVHAGQDLEEELPKKNQYKKNSKKKDKVSKAPKAQKSPKKVGKSAPAHDINQPTMIIPAHHRSNAPLVALLLLTVILGATVGALAYLFFFQ